MIYNPDNIFPLTKTSPKGETTTWRDGDPDDRPMPRDEIEDIDPSDTFDTQVHY